MGAVEPPPRDWDGLLLCENLLLLLFNEKVEGERMKLLLEEVEEDGARAEVRGEAEPPPLKKFPPLEESGVVDLKTSEVITAAASCSFRFCSSLAASFPIAALAAPPSTELFLDGNRPITSPSLEEETTDDPECDNPPPFTGGSRVGLLSSSVRGLLLLLLELAAERAWRAIDFSPSISSRMFAVMRSDTSFASRFMSTPSTLSASPATESEVDIMSR